MYKEILAEMFSNVENEINIQTQEAFRSSTRLDQRGISLQCINYLEDVKNTKTKH